METAIAAWEQVSLMLLLEQIPSMAESGGSLLLLQAFSLNVA